MSANNATTWQLSVFESDMTCTQKLICCYLRTYMNSYNVVAWPSAQTIADHCGICRKTVNTNLSKIQKAGFLVHVGYSAYGTKRYQIGGWETVTHGKQLPNDRVMVTHKLTKELNNPIPKGGKRFKPPTVQEIREYGTDIDADKFFDFYESKGWMVGKNKMKDWKAAVRNWKRGETKNVKRDNRPGPQYGGTAYLDENNNIVHT